MSLPTSEQETAINYSRNGESCNIWTCDSTVMTKLDKIYPCTQVHKDHDGNIWAKEYVIPKRLLSFRTDKTIMLSPQPKRKLSDKQREVLKKMNEQRSQNLSAAVNEVISHQE